MAVSQRGSNDQLTLVAFDSTQSSLRFGLLPREPALVARTTSGVEGSVTWRRPGPSLRGFPDVGGTGTVSPGRTNVVDMLEPEKEESKPGRAARTGDPRYSHMHPDSPLQHILGTKPVRKELRYGSSTGSGKSGVSWNGCGGCSSKRHQYGGGWCRSKYWSQRSRHQVLHSSFQYVLPVIHISLPGATEAPVRGDAGAANSKSRLPARKREESRSNHNTVLSVITSRSINL